MRRSRRVQVAVIRRSASEQETEKVRVMLRALRSLGVRFAEEREDGGDLTIYAWTVESTRVRNGNNGSEDTPDVAEQAVRRSARTQAAPPAPSDGTPEDAVRAANESAPVRRRRGGTAAAPALEATAG